MIHKVAIRNFRSIRKLDLELDPHVTTICGESYQGKSNLIRAFRWVALNRPASTRMIRWGTKKCRVTLWAKDRITRSRSKTVNSYKVNGYELKAFGNDVPAKVSKALNLSDINFQIQQEMPHGDGPLFWFALTPGQISKRLNRIINLDVIDGSLQYVQKQLTKARTASQICHERMKTAKAKMSQLTFVDKLTKQWEMLRRTEREQESATTRQCQLEELLTDIEHHSKVHDRLSKTLAEMDRDLCGLEMERRSMIEETNRIESLQLIVNQIVSETSKAKDTKDELEYARKDYKRIFGRRCPLCGSQVTS